MGHDNRVAPQGLGLAPQGLFAERVADVYAWRA
jgi:hypothetical protein